MVVSECGDEGALSRCRLAAAPVLVKQLPALIRRLKPSVGIHFSRQKGGRKPESLRKPNGTVPPRATASDCSALHLIAACTQQARAARAAPWAAPLGRAAAATPGCSGWAWSAAARSGIASSGE